MMTQRKVLIVDDDEDVRESLSSGLTKAGFDTVIASSATEAALKLVQTQFDCIILDLRLGRGSGEQVIQFIKNNSTKNTITPVLILSAHVSPLISVSLTSQVSRILMKPIRLMNLIREVQMAVQNSESGPKLAA